MNKKTATGRFNIGDVVITKFGNIPAMCKIIDLLARAAALALLAGSYAAGLLYAFINDTMYN